MEAPLADHCTDVTRYRKIKKINIYIRSAMIPLFLHPVFEKERLYGMQKQNISILLIS